MIVKQTLNIQKSAVRSVLLKILQMDPNTFVVGGAVRDHFLGKDRTNDLDLAIGINGCEAADRIVSFMGEGVTHVPLDKETGISRIIIWKDACFSLDVGSLQGADIYEDLAKRDFTINAMAIPLRDFLDSKFAGIIDPMKGLSDLSQSLIRACSDRCFTDDPLRILRAHRFATLLGFHISSQTRALMKPSIPKLATVSAERLREEIFLILSQRNAFHTLDIIQEDQTLDTIFPEIIPARGFEQNDYHHLDVFDHSMETLRCLEGIFTDLPRPFRRFEDCIEKYLDFEIVKYRQRRALLKLAALFHDLGKPHSLTIDESGRRRFSGHEAASEEITKQIASRLRLARKEEKVLCQWVRGHMRAAMLTLSPIPQKGVRRLCGDFGEDIIGLLLLFIADRGATLGPRANKSDREALEKGAGEVLDYYFKSTESPTTLFVNGHDLINLFGMSEGPEIGRILKTVRELQEDGTVTNRQAALATVQRLLNS